jgi:acylphosphatase
MKQAMHMFIYGRVQGVGYRRFVELCALKMNLQGWVRNRNDGSVEVFVIGDDEKLIRFQADMHIGSQHSKVEKIDFKQFPFSEAEKFQILPDAEDNWAATIDKEKNERWVNDMKFKKPEFLLKTFLVCCFLLLSTKVHSQTLESSISSSRRYFATIVLCGVGGAVLGLSTLSFYGEPQEHISNIWTGLIVGAVAGTVIVVSHMSQQSNLLHPPKYFPEDKSWNTKFAAQKLPNFQPLQWKFTF